MKKFLLSFAAFAALTAPVSATEYNCVSGKTKIRVVHSGTEWDVTFVLPSAKVVRRQDQYAIEGADDGWVGQHRRKADVSIDSRIVAAGGTIQYLETVYSGNKPVAETSAFCTLVAGAEELPAAGVETYAPATTTASKDDLKPLAEGEPIKVEAPAKAQAPAVAPETKSKSDAIASDKEAAKTMAGGVVLAVIATTVVLFFLYVFFLPTVIASQRGHRSRLAIFAMNLLLGWTFIGWAAALIWALSADTQSAREEMIDAMRHGR